MQQGKLGTSKVMLSSLLSHSPDSKDYLQENSPVPIWPWSKGRLSLFPSVRICPERALACINVYSGSKSNRLCKILDFCFMGRLVTVKAVSVHVLNENEGNEVFPSKMKKSTSKNSINHLEECTLRKLILV